MATTNFVAGTLIESTWLNDVDAHVYDQATAAHTAANIAVVDTAGNFTATEVEGALAELATSISSATAVSGATTPTAVNLSNVSSVVNVYIKYQHIGDIVAFSGYAAVTVVTGGVDTYFELPPPVTTNMTELPSAIGNINVFNAGTYNFVTGGYINGRTTTENLWLLYNPATNGAQEIYFTGQYTIV